jgi:hypothetical protein
MTKIDDKFDEIIKATPAEIDAQLRAFGLDPERIKKEGHVFIQVLMNNNSLRAENERLCDDIATSIANTSSVLAENAALRAALEVVLDQVDYMVGNCRVNEMVGAVLTKTDIERARAALKHCV